MTALYEGMFLLDNRAVRTDWAQAKSAVTSALEKHGAKVLTARRWDERKLAYPIRRQRRATYLLAYFEHGGDGLPGLRRDLEIDERVLRYLILATEALPEGEEEKSRAELEAGFAPPPPPADDEAFVSQNEQAEAEEEVEPDSEGEGEGDEPESGGEDEAPKRGKRATEEVS